MLEIQDLHAYYGSSHIVQGVTFSVGKDEAVGLMGRNGVGKTTTLKSIMGLETRTHGEIKFEGKSISRLASHSRAGLGIGYVPEERAVFADMNVEENIRLGAMIHTNVKVQSALEVAYELFPILSERRRQLAGTLSGGQQKMLALARALALKPKLLMVDEPTEGLMPGNVELIGKALAKATREGIAVLLVDSSFDLVMATCTRLYSMDRGVLTGTFLPQEFSSPAALAERYLGGVPS